MRRPLAMLVYLSGICSISAADMGANAAAVVHQAAEDASSTRYLALQRAAEEDLDMEIARMKKKGRPRKEDASREDKSEKRSKTAKRGKRDEGGSKSSKSTAAPTMMPVDSSLSMEMEPTPAPSMEATAKSAKKSGSKMAKRTMAPSPEGPEMPTAMGKSSKSGGKSGKSGDEFSMSLGKSSKSKSSKRAKRTMAPTGADQPSAEPTSTPTVTPTMEPTGAPTATPTAGPMAQPDAPTMETAVPTGAPTTEPTTNPTKAPSASPTNLTNADGDLCTIYPEFVEDEGWSSCGADKPICCIRSVGNPVAECRNTDNADRCDNCNPGPASNECCEVADKLVENDAVVNGTLCDGDRPNCCRIGTGSGDVKFCCIGNDQTCPTGNNVTLPEGCDFEATLAPTSSPTKNPAKTQPDAADEAPTPTSSPTISSMPTVTLQPTDVDGNKCTLFDLLLADQGFEKYSTCGATDKPVCCNVGQGGNLLLDCRAGCAPCQQGVSSNDCCLALEEVGECGSGDNADTPVCCKFREGNVDRFECVATEDDCPN